MKLTPIVRRILANYEGETPGVKTQIARVLMNGALKGTGKLLMCAVDQGFEHGPLATFAPRPEFYDPQAIYRMAIAQGFSAFAAPLGLLESGSETFLGSIPLILKMTNGTALSKSPLGVDQAYTATLYDALRLGCVGVGLTLYPGATAFYEMLEEAREVIAEARSLGLMVVVWSYPRGDALTKEGERAVDVIAYGAHMAAQIGAHIVKVKMPEGPVVLPSSKNAVFQDATARVRHVVDAMFSGRRLVIFSGGETKSEKAVLDDIHAIVQGGGNGSIIGRNIIQRPEADADALVQKMVGIYKGRG